MDWTERIFRYCERGVDPTFWAEPVNALTNWAFIIAALAAALALARKPRATRGGAEALLIGLVFAMGVGSFLFHTYATKWAAAADTAPISIFMLAYFAYALRRFVALDWIIIVLALLGFAAVLKFTSGVQCDIAVYSSPSMRGCLNGTLAYAPAWVAMAGIGLALAVMRHPAWQAFAAASVLFLVSMAFRAVDWQFCDATRLAGHAVGTHFLWHILNAATLYILAMAAVRYGRIGP